LIKKNIVSKEAYHKVAEKEKCGNQYFVAVQMIGRSSDSADKVDDHKFYKVCRKKKIHPGIVSTTKKFV
jgi:hypothetical protein